MKKQAQINCTHTVKSSVEFPGFCTGALVGIALTILVLGGVCRSLWQDRREAQSEAAHMKANYEDTMASYKKLSGHADWLWSIYNTREQEIGRVRSENIRLSKEVELLKYPIITFTNSSPIWTYTTGTIGATNIIR